MLIRIIALCAAVVTLSGCIVTPRIEIAERIDFNFTPPDQKPMSYSDLLCCHECHA